MFTRILWILTVARAAIALIVAWLLYRAGLTLGPAIAIGIASPLVVHAVFIAAQFALARLHASPVPARFQLGAIGFARVYVQALWVSVLSYTLQQPLFGSRPQPSATPPGGSDRLPVLFIHGFFCNQAVWRPMARSLARQGHVTAAVNLEPVFGSIDAYVAIIEKGIRDLQARTGEEQIALVCHSMGGLAARAYLRARGTEEVARVVTIGTPHRGTAQARYGLSPSVAQMRLDSPWLTELARTEWPNVRQLFTVILSHHDNVVVPQAIQTFPEATTIELGGISHLAMLGKREVHTLVAQALIR